MPLAPLVLMTSALGSSLVDNGVLVAAAPVVRELGATVLWWALLFGACFGGNVTLVGSTANIVATGLLEKRYRRHIRFSGWIFVGLLTGVLTCLVAWGALALLSPLMPARPGRSAAIAAPAEVH